MQGYQKEVSAYTKGEGHLSVRLSGYDKCHNEEEVLPLFLKEIEKIYEVMHVKHNVEMEYLFVDDGSTDRTLMFLREQEAENPRVNYLSFSRNFGKEAAMFAGL